MAERTLGGGRLSVVVTGASGFIGTHLCRELVGRGMPVGAVMRRGTAPFGETIRLTSLDDVAALRAAIADATAVVHLAARAHVTRDRAPDALVEYRRVNVGGTRAVLDAMQQSGARRLIFVSSVKAVGESTPSGFERCPDDIEPHPIDAYGITKLEAEDLVRDRAGKMSIRATVIRLPLVYGPGVRANMLSLLRLVDRQVPLPFARVTNQRSFAYVGNVTDAIASLLATDSGPGPYFVSDREDLSTPELIRAIAQALGVRPRLFAFPVTGLRIAAAAAGALAPVLPTRGVANAVERLVGSLAVDSSGLWRVVGHGPPFSVEQGMKATAAWYRAAPSAAPDTR